MDLTMALYGGTTPPISREDSTTSSTPTDAHALANKLYGDLEVATRPARVNRQRELHTIAGMSTAERTAFEQRVIAEGRQLGFGPAECSRLFDYRVNVKIAEARGGLADDQSREAQLQDSNERTFEEARAKHGDRAHVLLADVQRDVDAIPELKAVLGSGMPGGNAIVLDAIDVRARG